MEDRRCYFEGPVDSVWEFNHASDLTRNPWRAVGHITIDEADLNDTWELPSLAESDCAGELELIRYTVCTSAMAFADSAAAAT